MAEPRFVANESTPDLYKRFTISFPGGTLTTTRDVLASIFVDDLLPGTCAPTEVTVSRRQYSRTPYPGGPVGNLITTEPYVLKNYSSGRSSRAAAGEAIRFLINGRFWTARLTGSHQNFMDWLCDNQESLEGESTYWESNRGKPFLVTHSSGGN